MVLRRISSVAMALVFAASAWPVQAAPLMRIDPGTGASSNVIQVQARHCPPQGCRPSHGNSHWNGHGPNHGRPGYRPQPSRPGYWHGHQGYRDPRPGYRRGSDGWWYPLAAFGVGALLGGAIANQPQQVAPPTLSRAHLQWCENQYRSYRASDNTFQPYEGPRRACISPYS